MMQSSSGPTTAQYTSIQVTAKSEPVKDNKGEEVPLDLCPKAEYPGEEESVDSKSDDDCEAMQEWAQGTGTEKSPMLSRQNRRGLM